VFFVGFAIELEKIKRKQKEDYAYRIEAGGEIGNVVNVN
jgi:hypothetical protein